MKEQNKQTKHGKHKRITIICTRCKLSFERQARRQGNKLCRACRVITKDKFTYWPSAKLQEVIDNEGQTFTGTDYEQYLPEIKEVLYNRINRQIEAQMKDYEIRADIEHDCPF